MGSQIIRRMTRRKAVERWKTKTGNCEATPQALWPVTKSLKELDEPKIPKAVQRPLRITHHPNEKANENMTCLDNQFMHQELCHENHERRVGD
jgi:hypothetical protein